MSMFTANAILGIVIWALGVIVTLLVAYWIIRLAVTHALRSHTDWLDSRSRR